MKAKTPHPVNPTFNDIFNRIQEYEDSMKWKSRFSFRKTEEIEKLQTEAEAGNEEKRKTLIKKILFKLHGLRKEMYRGEMQKYLDFDYIPTLRAAALDRGCLQSLYGLVELNYFCLGYYNNYPELLDKRIEEALAGAKDITHWTKPELTKLPLCKAIKKLPEATLRKFRKEPLPDQSEITCPTCAKLLFKKDSQDRFNHHHKDRAGHEFGLYDWKEKQLAGDVDPSMNDAFQGHAEDRISAMNPEDAMIERIDYNKAKKKYDEQKKNTKSKKKVLFNN